MSRYSHSADALQDLIAGYRAERLTAARAISRNLFEDSLNLVFGVLAAAFITLAAVGPLSFLIVRSIAHRLRAVTDAMTRLARNDTGVEIRGLDDLDEIGDMARAVGVFKLDAIALLDQQQRLLQLNTWFDIALNNMNRGLSMFDSSRRLLVCNQLYRDIYELPGKLTEPGTSIEDIIRFHISRHEGAPEAEDAPTLQEWSEAHQESLQRVTPRTTTRTLPNGRVISVACQPLPGGGWVDTHTDVTEKRSSEQKIARLARHDTLTDIGNRFSFRERLELAFQDPAGFAVHWIDLDRFKEVNDSLGHPAGDALLKSVAERLRKTVRQGDFVARLGGDEFAIIQTGAESEDQAMSLAGRVLRSLTEPYDLPTHLTVGASIGTALAPGHGTSPDDLLKNADIALYRAKSCGRGNAVFFRAEHEQELLERRSLEADLRLALQNDEFHLVYQPIIDLQCGRVSACEALIRWRHPRRGLVSPVNFIPIAEETGLISPIGEWALRRACRDAAAWPGHIRVAVNLSAVQFTSSDLYAIAAAALEDGGLPADRLELEVTETLLLQNDAATLEVLHKLRCARRFDRSR